MVKEGLSIDKFFNEHKDKDVVKYRFWEPHNRKMTYITISFPKNYDNNAKIFLKDIITEKDGVKFSFILMNKILETQLIKSKFKMFNEFNKSISNN